MQARNDPAAVQAMADAIRRQVPPGDLWHAAIMQVGGARGTAQPHQHATWKTIPFLRDI